MCQSTKFKLIAVLALISAVLQPWLGHCQAVKLPRAQKPLLLFGFETQGEVDAWERLKCSVATNPVSEGKQSMTFTIPKYGEVSSKWPGPAISWNSGRGYAVKDWSHYAQLSFDIWTDGTNAQELTIELRDNVRKNGATRRFVITPRKKNTLEFDLSAFSAVDLSNIQQLILYASTPERSFKATVDNFRLLPGVKPSIAEFQLMYPNYRNHIFPGQNTVKVTSTVSLEEYGLTPPEVALKLSLGERQVSTDFAGSAVTASLPCAELPIGKATLKAALIKKASGQELLSRTWQLDKITPAEAASLKVHVDAKNRTIVNGQPFFPLGWYVKADLQHLDEIADSPFNCVLCYDIDRLPRARLTEYLDRVEQKKLKFIFSIKELYPGSPYHAEWEGIKGNEQTTSALIETYKNHPAMLAWYMNDESPPELVPSFLEHYSRCAAADPTHPCFIVIDLIPNLKPFADTTDIMGTDPYPVPQKPLTEVDLAVEAARSATGGQKPVWGVQQAFAWYQYDSTNKDRAHLPTADELKTGRPPTHREMRNMSYLALTRGAKGLLYYCYYDMKALPEYAQMWKATKELGDELKTLSPVLLADEDFEPARFAPANARVTTLLKRYAGKMYLIAVNTTADAPDMTFDLPNAAGDQAKVVFENRSIKIENKRLTDHFSPYDVHVYEW